MVLRQFDVKVTPVNTISSRVWMSSYREIFADARVPQGIRDLMATVEGGMAFKGVSYCSSEIAWAYFYAVRVVRPSVDMLHLATEALCDCLEMSTDSNFMTDEHRASFDALWLNEPCVYESVVVDADDVMTNTFRRLFTALRMPELARNIHDADFVTLRTVHPSLYELHERDYADEEEVDADAEEGEAAENLGEEEEEAARVGVEVE